MLRTVRQFITDNAQRLEQQLSEFEQNVANETRSLFDGMVQQPTQVRFTPLTKADQTFTTRQLAVCEVTTGSLILSLAAPIDGKPGFAWIVKRSTVNTVTIKPAGTAAGAARLINNTTSKAYGVGAVGLFALYYDGANWWAA